MRKNNKIDPKFESLDQPSTMLKHVAELTNSSTQTKHSIILDELLDQIELVDFQSLAFPESIDLRNHLQNIDASSEEAKEIYKRLNKMNITTKLYVVLSVELVLDKARLNKWGICRNHDYIYLYNGSYWDEVNKEEFQKFLGESAERMGVQKYQARYHKFREELFKQFMATAYLSTPEADNTSVYINLLNGTFEITANDRKLRIFRASDFLTYQLPFGYEPKAKAPLFQTYLDRVLPDIEKQKVLAEYLGFIFIKHGSNSLKEEKALVLYGSGANGKSVFFEIVNALFGEQNISSYSLQSLTNDSGYYRAKIANKLVNYASEINGKLEASIFKQLVSGEPVEARLPYGEPFTMKHYAKLIFNSNELPRDVEHTNAFFRRFMIVTFDETIPEAEQDKQLHAKIIDNELSGVFNWVLEGLERLLKQKRFTDCKAVQTAVEDYKTQSDSVKLYLKENDLQADANNYRLIKELYSEYRCFCLEDGFKPVNKSNFTKRLESFGILVERKNIGMVAFLIRSAK